MDRWQTGRSPVGDLPEFDPRGAGSGEALRVVVLAGDAGALGRGGAPGVDCLRVATAYEAAAEILASPTAALVVDLRLVSGRHLRLLEIARQMQVEVFAVGAVPSGLTSEDLTGVRLIARGDLPAAMTRLAQGPQDNAPPPQRGRGEPQPVAALDEEEAREDAVAEVVQPVPAEELRAEALRNRQRQTQSQPLSPSKLLTPEELAALMGDQP